MHGPEGVIPRAIEEVFAMISESGGSRQFVLTASYLEIYNEQVTDLLAGGEVNTLEGRGGGLVLQHLTHIAVSCSEDVLDAVVLGEKRRRVGETSANKQSSRSHTLLLLFLESRAEGDNTVRYSQLSLGDLAGSEGLRNVELTSREQRREGSCINKSLLALTQVVHALSEVGSRSQRVGFRDSKLTRILQPSLGGNAKTVIICTLAPGMLSRAESRSTLDFASRARCVENSVSVNIRRDGAQEGQIQALEKQLSELRDRVASLQDGASAGAKMGTVDKDLSEENAQLKRKIERLEAAFLGGPDSPLATVPTPARMRRRRTIAGVPGKERIALSPAALRDIMVRPSEDLKVELDLSDSPTRSLARKSNDNGVGLLGPHATPEAKNAWASLTRHNFSCPRLGLGSVDATPQTRSRLRQPGWGSARPLRRCETSSRHLQTRCETPPRRASLQPVAISFSPISTAAELEISGSEGTDGTTLQQCLVKIPTPVEGSSIQPESGETVVFDDAEIVRLQQELSELKKDHAGKMSLIAELKENERELIELREAHAAQVLEIAKLKEKECELSELRKDHATQVSVIAEFKKQQELFEQRSKDRTAQMFDFIAELKEKEGLRDELSELRRDHAAQTSLIVELREKERLKDELLELKKQNTAQTSLISELKEREQQQSQQESVRLRQTEQELREARGSREHEGSLKEYSTCPAHVGRIVDVILNAWRAPKAESLVQLVFAYWRTVLAEARAWNAEESRAWLLLRLERCACGERDLWEVRSRDYFEAARARARRHAQEDAKERERDAPALFPAGAGAFGTLLEQMRSAPS